MRVRKICVCSAAICFFVRSNTTSAQAGGAVAAQLSNSVLQSQNLDDAAGASEYGFVDASKHDADACAYCDKGHFAALVTHACRSSNIKALPGGNDDLSHPTFTKGHRQLNAGMSYRQSEQLILNVTGKLTQPDRRNDIVYPGLLRSFIHLSRTAFAVRAFC